MTTPSTATPSETDDPRASRLPRALTSDPGQRVTVSIITGLVTWRVTDQAHPQLRRWAVPVFCAALGLPSLLNPTNRAHLPAELALTLAFTLPLLWREKRPGLVFAVTTLASVAALQLNILNGADAARIVALYNVGRYGTPRQLATACAITATQLVLWASVFWNSGHLQHAKRPEMVTVLAMLAVTACAGIAITGRLAKAYIVALETERNQQARLAATHERARVSREMHDVLGHTLAVIIGLADGAAALARTQPDRSADTLRIIADSGRGALAELRRLLTVMDERQGPHDGATPLTPQPGLADLDSLLDRVRAAGPTATRHTEGELARLTPGLQLTVYRIVQEALTNTLKHAAPDTVVTVSLLARTDTVRVTVEDTGPPRSAPARFEGSGGGQGLLGMRERAALYQGRITAGPTEGGGWSVDTVLTLPRTIPAPSTENLPA
ncbi:sensor histidine kinase [Streptomyces liangshanensis]|uniref:histidine kinase n=1 Tax=Streptomyces liangshanensis TaxID=2717324 RepID=A0A6G9GU15_9ACTN|nr:histidine kinase [Streptomyces liangshanensis]QIQ01566.1 two-component sensor histidine kinase [Streptomyces liangshanensis]